MGFRFRISGFSDIDLPFQVFDSDFVYLYVFADLSHNVCVSPNPHRLKPVRAAAHAQLVGAGLCRAAFPMESGRNQGTKEP